MAAPSLEICPPGNSYFHPLLALAMSAFKHINGLNLAKPKAATSEKIETKLFATQEMLVKAPFGITGTPFGPGAAVKVEVPTVSSK